MSVGTDADGGYTVPEGFQAELEASMLAFNGPRRVCRVLRTATGNALPLPTSDDTGNSGVQVFLDADYGFAGTAGRFRV